MKNIIFTRVGSMGKISLSPNYWILHQPRKVRIPLGKDTFGHTTLMSIFDPNLCVQVLEPYESAKKAILIASKDSHENFSEFRHFETGTLFLINTVFWQLMEPDSGRNQTSLTSVVNYQLWVPIAETFEQACSKMDTLSEERNGK